MYDNLPDIPLIRTLFSRVTKVIFGFADASNFKEPFIQLYFDVNAHKIATAVLEQIAGNMNQDALRLSFYENAGDYLTLSFLWQQYPAMFSSSPDEYSKKDYRVFIKHVFYNEPVKLYFYCMVDQLEVKIHGNSQPAAVDFIPTVYYQRIP